MGKQNNVRAGKVTWQSLNKRQQEYLWAIYQFDQVQEHGARLTAKRTHRMAPAEQWRWIEYADTVMGHTPFKQRLVDEGVVDQGTGSTFDALERRGLILVNYHHPLSNNLKVRLTTKGRALIRAAFDLSPQTQSHPVGTLRQWHWQALACIYRDRDKDQVAFPREIGEFTIRRLETYKVNGEERPLAAWVYEPCEPYHVQDSFDLRVRRTLVERRVLRLTAFGQHYYRDNWSKYRQMYPDVDSPEPLP